MQISKLIVALAVGIGVVGAVLVFTWPARVETTSEGRTTATPLPLRETVGAVPEPAPVSNPDAAAVEQYLEWLSATERARTDLGRRSVAALGRPAPSAGQDAEARQSAAQRNLQSAARAMPGVAEGYRQLVDRARRSRPAVPEDCRVLDDAYAAALQAEADGMRAVSDALARQDLPALAAAVEEGRSLGGLLARADEALAEVCLKRRIRKPLDIRPPDPGGAG